MQQPSENAPSATPNTVESATPELKKSEAEDTINSAKSVTVTQLHLRGHKWKKCMYPYNYCNKKDTSGKYISRISQRSEAELQSGKVLMEQVKSPPYFYYFSLAVDSCDVNIKDIDIKECIESDASPGKKYMSLKLKREGSLGMDLEEKAADVAKSQNEKQLFRFILDMQLYLLISVGKLNAAKIVHGQLTASNIMYNDKGDTPKISDFGYSHPVVVTWKEYEEMKNKTGASSNAIPCKTFDETLLTALCNKTKADETTLEEILSQFMGDDNSLFRGSIWTDAERSSIYTRYREMFQKGGKNMETFKSECLKTMGSWNEYAVVATFLELVTDHAEWIPEKRSEYIELSKRYILQTADAPALKKELQKMLIQSQNPL